MVKTGKSKKNLYYGNGVEVKPSKMVAFPIIVGGDSAYIKTAIMKHNLALFLRHQNGTGHQNLFWLNFM